MASPAQNAATRRKPRKALGYFIASLPLQVIWGLMVYQMGVGFVLGLTGALVVALGISCAGLALTQEQ